MEKKPTVLICLNSFWSFGAGISGGDQIIVQLLKLQRARFGRVYVLTSDGGEQLLRETAPELTFIRTSVFGDRLGLFPSYVLRSCVALVKLLRLPPIDVTLTGSDFFPDVVPSCFLRWWRPRTRWQQFVFHVYPDWRTRPGSKLRSFVAQGLQRASFRLIRKADQTLTINQEVQRYLATRAGIQEARIAKQHLGINLDEIVTAESSDPRAYDGVFLARLVPSKGIFDLPKIWKRVTERHPGARLGIIGGGKDLLRTQLQAEFERLGIGDSCELLGFLDNQTAFSILKRSRVFLFPSHEEGFGLAIAEALACGLPVVSWDLSIYDEIFGETILRARENDLDGFAAHVARVLAEPASGAEERRNFVRRYSWHAVTEAIAARMAALSAAEA